MTYEALPSSRNIGTVRAAVLGRAVVLGASLLLLADGILQLLSPDMIVQALTHIGFAPDEGPRLAVITLTCAALLAIPRLAPLGAVLTTGFLGGAICAHFRVEGFGSPPQLLSLFLGLAIWVGLALADVRVRAALLGAPRRPLAD
ncbi:DoxX family protein [Hansschlegelia beijingensis]|uniref:DoxX family protein n=1 Tax=Hansschlegelia beijingensis TaxID=1133344 RepID=UPI00387EFF07